MNGISAIVSALSIIVFQDILLITHIFDDAIVSE